MNTEQSDLAPARAWLASPMDSAFTRAVERTRRAEDVVRVAIMPDVHIAGDVCVGTVMATRRLLYPGAVGGDIGCGMLAIAFDASAKVLQDAKNAGVLLRSIGERIPTKRHHRMRKIDMPGEIDPRDLSTAQLQKIADREGRLQFGTLGGGNHFVEMQADEDDRLWLMVHTGSRAMGQEVKRHHVAQATLRSASMMALDGLSTQGQAYLNDQGWARRFAESNRRTIAGEVADILRSLFKVDAIESTMIRCDHNHVQRELHFGEPLLVHRKGAMPAASGMIGVIPGSMGTMSCHVEGRGCADAMNSSAHGAGRIFSRQAARERFARGDLKSQMRGVWFDPRLSESLREESPRSYKDLRAVMRAQNELVKVTRTLRPLLVFKGT